tara:strand:+ start:2529 stop:3053 length:525 start_codon:yes stop_codon:yes gene_type:complete
MFVPSKLQATRATAAAKRRVQKWALEVLDKEKNKHYDALTNATINIREIQCNDPLCATTGEIDTVVSLTTPLINLTSKILKSCVNCTQVDVIEAVTELCRNAGIRYSSDSANNTTRKQTRMSSISLPSQTRRRLLEKDDDEASAMRRQHQNGGISCPCCNPDDPGFIVDKFLMM